MRLLNPTFLQGVLLMVGSFRFFGEPLGFVLLLLGGIVLLLQTMPKRDAALRGT